MSQPAACPTCGQDLESDAIKCPGCGADRSGATLRQRPDAGGPAAETDFADDPRTAELLRGALAPNYVLVRQLDRGGMGTVYLAREPALKRDVAVKVLSEELSSDPTAQKRFEREAQASASLSHPNVVAIHSVGELANGRPYFVMQYVKGASLDQRLEQEGRLSIGEARSLIGEVASALAAAHRKGIIHRDVKPANVLYDAETGRALVSDFGIASVLASEELGDESGSLTASGTILGTPAYMSPEQLLGDPVTERSDMYSLGLVAYRVLTGRSPFDVRSTRELMAAIIRDEPKKLSEIRPDVDPELEAMVESCLRRDPAERPEAAEIARRLAPRAGTLLEWPPPGLESIRGKAWGLSGLTGASSALFVASLLPSLAGARWEPQWPLIAVAGLGALSLLGVAGWATRLVWQVNRAGRLGYGWLTIIETLCDRRGDTGSLIAGVREYVHLKAPVSDRLRVLRIVAACATYLAALWPVVGLAAVMYLASRGVLEPVSLLTLVLLPAGVLGLLALFAVDYEVRKFRGARREFRRRRSLEESISGLIGSWYERFESVRSGQRIGRGMTGRRALGWAVGLALAAAVTAAAAGIYPLALASLFFDTAWSASVPQFQNTMTKIEAASVVRPYRLSPDPSITATDAGDALHVLGFGAADWNDGSRMATVVRRPARTYDWSLPAGHTSSNNPFGRPIVDPTHLFPATAEGLTSQQREYLRSSADHPARREYSIVARAASVDIIGTRYLLPLPDTLHPMFLPIPRFSKMKDASYSRMAEAALLLADGRTTEAEAAAREIISFGIVLLDEGPTLIEALIGTVISGLGRRTLTEIYRATGRTAEADRISATVNSIVTQSEAELEFPPGLREVPQNSEQVRQLQHRLMHDPDLHRSIKWGLLETLAYSPCTNLREIIFGPKPEHEWAIQQARDVLVRRESEAKLFEFLSTGIERSRHRLNWDLYGSLARISTALGGARAQGCAGAMLIWLDVA